jgi:hypothetical protein
MLELELRNKVIYQKNNIGMALFQKKQIDAGSLKVSNYNSSTNPLATVVESPTERSKHNNNKSLNKNRDTNGNQ